MVKDQTADILGFLGRIYTVPVAYSFFPSPFNNVTSRPSSQAGHGAASCCSGQTPDSQECSQLWIRTKAPLVSCVPPAPSTWGGGLAAISSFYTDAWKPGCLCAAWLEMKWRPVGPFPGVLICTPSGLPGTCPAYLCLSVVAWGLEETKR